MRRYLSTGRFRARHLQASLCLIIALALSTGASAQQIEPTAEEAFASAFELYANRFYERAAEAFARFGEQYPEHPNAPEALYYRAESTLGAGLEDEATQLYIIFYERYPIHPLAFQARLALGKYFYETDQYERTLETLQLVVADEPDDDIAAKAHYWMGESALALGRFDQGLQYLRVAAEEYRETSTAPIAQYAIGFAYTRRERPAEAARAFEMLSIRYPDSPLTSQIGLSLAESYYELAEYDRALEEILARIRDLTGEAEQRATFLLAECYNHLGRHEEAIVHYKSFTEQNPASRYHRRALYGLAWNYHFARDYSAAASTFERVYGLQDQDDLAMQSMYYQGVNLKLQGRPEQAAEHFRAVADTWPSGSLADRALFELGMAHYELRRWDAAEEAFEELQKSYPRSPALGEALRMAGEARVAQGDFTGAGRAYDAAISLAAAPEELRAEVAFQKAWLAYRTEEYAAAAPAFLALFQSEATSELGADALFWAAESNYQLSNYRQAERLFVQFQRQFPTHKQIEAARYALGWTYFKQARYSLAIDQFERFLRTYREEQGQAYGSDARLRLADSYYAIKRYEDAIREYRRVQGDAEDYAVFQTGQALAQAARNDEAIETLEELIEQFDYSEWREEALYTIGYLHLLNADYEASIETFSTLVQRFPRHPLAARAQYGIGDTYYNRRMWEQAVAAYRAVLDRFPSSSFVVDAVGSMAYALSALDRPEEMEEIIETYASRNPNSPFIDELRFRQAEVKFQSGELAGAIADFQRFIREARSEALAPSAYMYVAQAYQELKQAQEAAAYLQQIVRRYPASSIRPEAEKRLGSILLEDGRFDQALDLYRSARNNEKADAVTRAEARYGEGMALLGLGRLAEAEALLSEVVEAEGFESLAARLGMARIRQTGGRVDEAESLYRQVAEESPDEIGAEALYRLGALLVDLGRPADALEELGRLEVLFPGFDVWMARGYLAQARAFRSLGQAGNADRMYENVIQFYPDTPYAVTAAEERASLGDGQ